MSRTPSRSRAVRNARFDVVTYINRVLSDLKTYLGSAYEPLMAVSTDPIRFRETIADLLSDADCMESVPYYAALRQVEACVSKLPSWGAKTAQQRREAALDKFLAAERGCVRANKRIAHFARHFRRLPATLRTVFDSARQEIASFLGCLPPYEDLFAGCGFGPGLSFGLSADQRNLMFKIAHEQTVTPEARGLAVQVLRDQFPFWAQYLADSGIHLRVVQGNRIAFVPKSAKIDRTIGIEPSLNVFLQKGVDEYLKARLPRMGLRLRDQDYSINLIKLEHGRVATIDLSSASDSVSIEAVRWLLPPDWFALLDTLRSKFYTVDKGKTWHRYAKFSSMGNAVTFPLESMIFMAIARACVRYVGFCKEAATRLTRVYGDDIIVPWEAAALVIECLQFLGFRTNPDKTFVFGPFKETCGVDLLDGVDVRPVYLRELPDRPWHIAGLFNRLLCNRFGFRFDLTLAYLHSLVEKPLYGPAYMGWSSVTSCDWHEWYAGKNQDGDAYFFSPHAHHEPVVVGRRDHNQRCYSLERWSVVRRKRLDGFDENARYLAFLLGLRGGEPQGDPVYGVTNSIYYGDFPHHPCFPAIYADPRPASDRVIRQVLRAELGDF